MGRSKTEATRPEQYTQSCKTAKEFPMKRFIMSVALVAVLSVAAQAADKKGSSNSSSGNKSIGGPTNHNPIHINGSNTQTLSLKNTQTLQPKYTGKDYHLLYGTKSSFGFSFKGLNHDHWTYRCWIDSCGCYCNWCPCS